MGGATHSGFLVYKIFLIQIFMLLSGVEGGQLPACITAMQGDLPGDRVDGHIVRGMAV
jgi:hypothetical protein